MINKSSLFQVIAAVYGLTAVILGAMGSHAFDFEVGSRPHALFQHALLYMLLHALLLMWLSTQLDKSFWLRAAAWALSLGVLLFSGGLLVVVFVGKTGFSWVTPVGGSLIILAWLNLVIHGFKTTFGKNS